MDLLTFIVGFCTAVMVFSWYGADFSDVDKNPIRAKLSELIPLQKEHPAKSAYIYNVVHDLPISSRTDFDVKDGDVVVH